MKVIVNTNDNGFQNQLAIIATDLYCPIVKNDWNIVMYVYDEAQKDMLLKAIYNKASLNRIGYNSIKVKKYTPFLDRRYKKENKK